MREAPRVLSWREAPADRWIVELTAPAELRAEPDLSSEVVATLPQNELAEAFGDVDPAGEASPREWLLVRAPLEEHVDMMSDKPLQYRDGWLHRAAFRRAPHQLGDKVAALAECESHPFYDAMRLVPPWRGGAPIPPWLVDSLSELQTGKVGGVAMRGRFVVQRPSGAIPERAVAVEARIMTRKQRGRYATLAGALGLLFSSALGVASHVGGWLQGERWDAGPLAWPQLVGWFSIVAIIITPATAGAGYVAHNTRASTVAVVAWINMLLYNDIFGQ